MKVIHGVAYCTFEAFAMIGIFFVLCVALQYCGMYHTTAFNFAVGVTAGAWAVSILLRVGHWALNRWSK